MNKKETQEAIKVLEDALMSDKVDFKAPTLVTNDLSAISDKYLSKNAKKSLSKKSRNTTVVEETGTYSCVFFAKRVKKGNEEMAVKHLANIANELDKYGQIHSCLSNILSIELAKIPFQPLASIVICYILVPDSEKDIIEKKFEDSVIEEGKNPKDLGDLTTTLEDGEFLAEIRISCLQNVTYTKDLPQREIDSYLAMLPKGTVVRETVTCAITSLSIPYEVKFYNPLLTEVKRVKLLKQRAVTMVGDKVEQFNVIVGMEYFDKDNEKLYGA